MQKRHFWYVGRHRFLLGALDRCMASSRKKWKALDLGGGTGGWLAYLLARRRQKFRRLALAEPSSTALALARKNLRSGIQFRHTDLRRCRPRGTWDLVFLLDVIEHLKDDRTALKKAAAFLRPGGWLFVTAPALQQFWSYNDELGGHFRRYHRKGFQKLADESGMRLVDSRYFMFFLSPLYWLVRHRPGLGGMSHAELAAETFQRHQTPQTPWNELLTLIFCLETPLGHRLRFPWGTSLLGVFRKP